MKRVGIYSGTFDPIHDGHVAFAREAKERYGLEKVFFLVEPRPRRKQGVKSLEHRIAMVDLAVAKEPYFGQIILEQPRFTIHETLPVLHARFQGAQMFMLMGDDVLQHLASWPHIERLVNLCEIIVGVRDDRAKVDEHLKSLAKIRSLHVRHHVFDSKLPKFASTTIRRSLRKGRVPEGLHPEVVTYIQEHGLYSPAED